MKYSPEQTMFDVGAAALASNSSQGARSDDCVRRLHPTLGVGVVCRSCGARVGKSRVSPSVGTVAVPIEGVHAKRVAAAREQGVA